MSVQRRVAVASGRGADFGEDGRTNWVGRDFSGRRDPRRSGVLVPLLIAALIAALGVAALRIDLIRVRYALAATADQEARLLEEGRALLARKRSLRDPVQLAREARAQGFEPPTHVYAIPDPARAAAALPQVAAGPPTAPKVSAP